ncbi:hypothetical protein Ddc_15224 [Ditylenchus destructor]|nr:hypothetical protein Ddc_15224 [Ditylenchus destructor]
MPSKYDDYYDIRAEHRNMIAKCLQDGCTYTYKWDSHKSNFSLRKHLENNHPDVFKKLDESEKKDASSKQNLFARSKQLSLTQCFNAEEKQLMAPTVSNLHSHKFANTAINLSGIISNVQASEIAFNEETHGMFDEIRFDPTEARAESPDDAAVNNRLKLLHEINHYLAKPPAQTYASTAKFWNDPINSNMYPHLKELFKWYHSTPSSAAETERLFSIAKLILSDLRKRLSPDNFEKLLILHSNLLILNYSY